MGIHSSVAVPSGMQAHLLKLTEVISDLKHCAKLLPARSFDDEFECQTVPDMAVALCHHTTPHTTNSSSRNPPTPYIARLRYHPHPSTTTYRHAAAFRACLCCCAARNTTRRMHAVPHHTRAAA